MPVAVLRPFGPRGTVETLIARSHLMPSRARRSTASSYHISGYLGQRDEPPTLDALALTLAVHTKGKGIAGTYTFEVAEQKQYEVLSIAKVEEHPLRVEVERA